MLKPLLDRASRVLKMDLHYLLSAGALLSSTQFTSALISIAVTIAFANLLPLETYGIYKYILSVLPLLGIIALPGVDTAMTQSASRGFDGVLASGIRLKFFWSLTASVASLAYSLWSFTHNDPMFGKIFLMTAVLLPLLDTTAVFTSYLNGKKAYRFWTSAEIIVQVGSAATLIGTLFLTSSIYALMLAYFIPYIVIRGAFTIWTFKHYVHNTDTDPELLTYSKSVTIFNIAARILLSLDQIVLFHFLGPVQVAIFALATAIPMRAQSLFRTIGAITFPKFATQDPRDIARTLPRKMGYFAVVLLLCCVAYALIAPFLFTHIFPKYLPALRYSQVAMFYTFSALTYPFSAFLFAHKKMRENYILTAGSFIAKASALVIFVPRYGLWGAVISMLAGSVAVIGITYYYLYKKLR